MLDDISFSLPLKGAVQFAASLAAGTLTGVILVRSGLASARDLKEALLLKNTHILQVLLGSFLTAVLLLPLLRVFHTPAAAPEGYFWQSLIGGILCGSGLFLASRTPLSALAGFFKGELSALWFLAGAAGTALLLDELDFSPKKLFAGKDFSTGSLSTKAGWNFFDPTTPALWITAGIALLLIVIYVVSALTRKGK